MKLDLNFGPYKKSPCIHCKREKHQHRANTFECPMGKKSRCGYTNYGPKVYEAKVSKTVFKPIPHWSGTLHKGKVPKAYEVWVNGKLIGTVEQGVCHTYRKVGRLRYGDRYTLKWQAKLPDGTHAKALSIYADTRKMAAGWLTE